MVREFAIVDMFAQREAIKSFVKGWSEKEILEWLEVRGELSSRYVGLGDEVRVFDFISRENIHTIFRIEYGEIIFLYER